MITLGASYYQQFDADYDLDVPGEGYGGWRKADVEIDLDHTALVVMHAWEMGTREMYTGWHRAVEYMPRARIILETVFPPLLDAVREHDLTLFHVVGGGDYYRNCSGYRKAVQLAGLTPRVEQIAPDPALEALRRFRKAHVFVGAHNERDVAHGFESIDFAPPAKPVGDEGIAENAEQLYALCVDRAVNHLIYIGFAVNWCLLMSPGGMLDMSRRGVMCSVLRQAVTAVENKETARTELGKQLALWRISLAFGFVFDVDNFVRGISS